MPEVYDERGEPVGTMPVEEAVPQEQPVIPQRQTATGGYPSGAPFITPSLAGRTDVIPTPEGGLGVPTGGSDAGPSPADIRDRDRYLSQMAQLGRLDQAQKDVEQAMRFLGMRGVERDVQAGIPYHQALSKHLPYISWNNPQQADIYSKIIERSQPPAPLTMTNLNGVQVLRTPRGDRIVPQSAIPRPPVTSAQSIPLTDPSGAEIPGYFAVQSPTGRGSTIHRKLDTEPQLTPGQRRLSLNDDIRDKEADIAAVPWVPEKDKVGRAARKQRLDVLNAELDELRKQRPSLLKKDGPKGSASVPAKADRKIGQSYKLPGGPKGPAGTYRWTADGWEPMS